MKRAKKPTKTPLWIYRCIKSKIVFNYYKIWTISAQGNLLTNGICKTEKKSKATLFLNEKIQKNPQKTHFGNIGASDLRFYSIALKFGA